MAEEITLDDSGNYVVTTTLSTEETESLTEAQIDERISKLENNIAANQEEILKLQSYKDSISVVKTADEEAKAAEALAAEEAEAAEEAKAESAEESLPVEE